MREIDSARTLRVPTTSAGTTMTDHSEANDGSGKDQLSQATKEKIDRKLDQLKVSKTESGKDERTKPDTEGSNSSSKNLDEENE